MTETLTRRYSSESTQLSIVYQHDRVEMVFKNLCVLVLWVKEALALEGLISPIPVASIKRSFREYIVGKNIIGKIPRQVRRVLIQTPTNQ